MATPAEKTFTWDEVAQHNSVSAGVWVVIDGHVYDVTQFVDEVRQLSASSRHFSSFLSSSLLSIQVVRRFCWTMQVIRCKTCRPRCNSSLFLFPRAGRDATSAFRDVGHSDDAIRVRDGFYIGRIASDDLPSEERPSLSRLPYLLPSSLYKLTEISSLPPPSLSPAS